MRILFVAPDDPDLNHLPEIRRISAMHTVHVLAGPVTLHDIYDAVRDAYDVVHFTIHMQADDLALDAMALTADEWIDLATAAQICKLAKAKLVFFNTCLGARFGAYAVQHGTPAAIFTTIAMPVTVAWRLPLAFYERCSQIEEQERVVDFKTALDSVDSGDGLYGCLVSRAYFGPLLDPMREALAALEQRVAELVVKVDRNSAALETLVCRRLWLARGVWLVSVLVLLSALWSLGWS